MLKRIFVYPYILWMTIFIVAPLLIVVWFSITGTGYDGRTIFTLYYFFRFFEPLYISILLRSIRLAAISTAISLMLGYPLAYALARYFRTKSFLLFLFLVPMWMNFLLRTYAWLTILEQNGLLNVALSFLGLPTIDILFTDTAVILGMVYNFLPFMVLPIYTALLDIDKSYIEAAQDLGAGKIKLFTKVVFPFSIPGIISGITMVFMPAVTTFIIPNLLGGGQFILVGNLIEQQFLRVGNWQFGSAISVILIVLILFMMALIKLLDRQPVNRESGGTLYD